MDNRLRIISLGNRILRNKYNANYEAPWLLTNYLDFSISFALSQKFDQQSKNISIDWTLDPRMGRRNWTMTTSRITHFISKVLSFQRNIFNRFKSERKTIHSKKSREAHGFIKDIVAKPDANRAFSKKIVPRQVRRQKKRQTIEGAP